MLYSLHFYRYKHHVLVNTFLGLSLLTNDLKKGIIQQSTGILSRNFKVKEQRCARTHTHTHTHTHR